jgi:hypothetical protein
MPEIIELFSPYWGGGYENIQFILVDYDELTSDHLAFDANVFTILSLLDTSMFCYDPYRDILDFSLLYTNTLHNNQSSLLLESNTYNSLITNFLAT